MTTPRHPTAARLALTLALATAPAWATVEPQGPTQTVCPNPALTAFDRESAGHVWPALTGTPLAPGGSVLTLGTNPSESPELSDVVCGVSLAPSPSTRHRASSAARCCN